MELNLTSVHKSLAPPLSVTIPDFTIITGINGAGKTHLLSAILIGAAELIENGITLNARNSDPNINSCKYVAAHTLAPNDSSVIQSQRLSQVIIQQWNQYEQFIKQFQINSNINIQQAIPNKNLLRIITKISEKAQKHINNLTNDDFHKYYPIDADGNKDIFQQNFSTLFKRYHERQDDNKYKRYLFNEGQKAITFLSDEEFLKSFGEEPWNFVNKIIEEAKLDYYVNSPVGSQRDSPFELKLINKINKAEIKFSELSSGEKVLMSLAFALYNSKFDNEFPKIILMDEPDASLHPSMSKQFLDVIESVFVKERGIKIIITTHSPSTVALSNENSLYIMNKDSVRIEKTTKDKALKILTSGVPSFSVNYENRRQIFVESQNDVLFYEKIYQKLAKYLIPEISFCFISSGESRTDKHGGKISNCKQVINITDILREAGNNFIWGIVDWDGGNKNTEFVKILGDGNRYSIENYLFDPLLVAALLLREKYITREDLSLNNNETYIDFRNFSIEQLQIISNFVTNKVSLIVNPKNLDMMESECLNGIKINIPVWYLRHQGHNLENQILKAFPELNALKKGKEEALKLEIINRVIDDIPELISIDFLNIFKNIQSI